VALDLYTATNNHAALDLNERSDLRSVPNPASVQVDEVHDPDIDAKFDIRCNPLPLVRIGHQ
jgi:hypothetical protein